MRFRHGTDVFERRCYLPHARTLGVLVTVVSLAGCGTVLDYGDVSFENPDASVSGTGGSADDAGSGGHDSSSGFSGGGTGGVGDQGGSSGSGGSGGSGGTAGSGGSGGSGGTAGSGASGGSSGASGTGATGGGPGGGGNGGAGGSSGSGGTTDCPDTTDTVADHTCALTDPSGTGNEECGFIPVCCVPNAQEKDYIDEVFKLLNEYRKSKGVPELTYDPNLEAAIQGHCIHMGIHSFFSHAAPEDSVSSPWTRAGKCGTSANGENIAQGYGSPAAVMNGWKNSPGHNANMLNASFKRVGIGYYNSYWGQIFGN